jgi:hypothetical protein
MHSAPVRPVVRRISSSTSIVSRWRSAKVIQLCAWWRIESIIVPSMSKMIPRTGMCQTPCLSDASMKTSRSPSSTFCVAETSTLVRRSLMRLLSST